MVILPVLFFVHFICSCEKPYDDVLSPDVEEPQLYDTTSTVLDANEPQYDTISTILDSVEPEISPIITPAETIPDSDVIIPIAAYYVATNGNDNNPGTLEQPFASWQKGFSAARPGDLVYIRGGIYHPVPTSAFGVFLDNKDGAEGNPIKIFAYPGEVPVMDMSTNTANTVGNYGIRMDNCDYWHLKGLHVTGASQHQLAHAAAGLLIISGNYNTFEQLESYANQGPGMRIQYNSEGNLVLNCDFYDNYDRYSPSPGGNADGIDMAAYERQGNERKNAIRGCRAWHNSDDGFDFVLNSGFVTIDSCWSFNNGVDQGNGSGFKLGENDGNPEGIPQRILTDCLSFGNQKQGFSQNESLVLMSFTNCVAYNNGYSGYFFYWHDLANIFNDCISYLNGREDILGSKAKGSNNIWNNEKALDQSDFEGLNASEASAPRKPNGSLPDIDFL